MIHRVRPKDFDLTPAVKALEHNEVALQEGKLVAVFDHLALQTCVLGRDHLVLRERYVANSFTCSKKKQSPYNH